MSPPASHLAQVVGGPLGSSAPSVVVRGITLAARSAGATVVVLTDRPGVATWDAAPLARLGALPATTTTLVHLGTGSDPDLSEAPEPPGPVVRVDHGLGPPAPLPPGWRARLDEVRSVHADPDLVSWWWQVVPPDTAQARLLADHPGPHVLAVGPLGARSASARTIAVVSALVQHLRPDATAALLGSDEDHEAPGLTRQVAELGLAACAVVPDAPDRLVRAHLDRADAYLSLQAPGADPALAHARAVGLPVVDRGASVAELAAAVSVAIDRPRSRRPTPAVAPRPPFLDALLERG